MCARITGPELVTIDCGEGSATRLMDVGQKLNICSNTWALCVRGKVDIIPVCPQASQSSVVGMG